MDALAARSPGACPAFPNCTESTGGTRSAEFVRGGLMATDRDKAASENLDDRSGVLENCPRVAGAVTVEAKFYRKLDHDAVKCMLCPRGCLVESGQRGHCGVRENREGTFYTLVHSRVCAAHVDPVEKKPLFHYLPGTTAFSIGTTGCNVSCKFCQNWSLSQSLPEQIPENYLPPHRVAALAKLAGCPSIAFTYNEPTVFAEYVMDVADAGHAAGIRGIAVSNGFIQPEARRQVYSKLDAVKIDLKAFTDSFYAKVVGGRLKPVLETLVALRQMGTWFEIVYLVLPGLNDDDEQLLGLARWIMANLGPEVPLHFTQFHPEFRMKNLPVTPVPTMERAKALADAEGLHYVYIGNVPGHPAQDTTCPQCHKVVVKRTRFGAANSLISMDGACPFCRHTIPGIWRA